MIEPSSRCSAELGLAATRAKRKRASRVACSRSLTRNPGMLRPQIAT